MPKLKTHKGAKDRIRYSGGGKLLRMKGGSSHLRRKKAKRTLRQYGATISVSKANRPALRRLLPYGG